MKNISIAYLVLVIVISLSTNPSLNAQENDQLSRGQTIIPSE